MSEWHPTFISESGPGMAERRDFASRARLVQAIATFLRQHDGEHNVRRVTLGAGGVPLDAVRRVLKRLAARGLVRIIDTDVWAAASPLRCDPPSLLYTPQEA